MFCKKKKILHTYIQYIHNMHIPIIYPDIQVNWLPLPYDIQRIIFSINRKESFNQKIKRFDKKTKDSNLFRNISYVCLFRECYKTIWDLNGI
jgi:hypothetical protein